MDIVNRYTKRHDKTVTINRSLSSLVRLRLLLLLASASVAVVAVLVVVVDDDGNLVVAAAAAAAAVFIFIDSHGRIVSTKNGAIFFCYLSIECCFFLPVNLTGSSHHLL